MKKLILTTLITLTSLPAFALDEIALPNGDLLVSPEISEVQHRQTVDKFKQEARALFNSLEKHNYRGELESHKLYEILAENATNDGEVTMLYIGPRKDSFPKANFLDRLEEHVELVAGLLFPLSQRSYQVYATEDYEIALVNFATEELMVQGFEQHGNVTGPDGDVFMDGWVWEAL